MAQARWNPADGKIRVVGSIGSAAALAATNFAHAAACCDLLELRLDLICSADGAVNPANWAHLRDMPLLFTARRREEGGAGKFDPSARITMLETSLTDASMLDLEVVSIGEMNGLLEKLKTAKIPWIASFHDFVKTPSNAELLERLEQAKAAGATVFKVAAMLENTQDLARLADFQLADHGIAVSTMGMGPLAPVSRLLCAQYGSVLNYGYLGEIPTAPGQWDAAMLKSAISKLLPIRR